MKYLVSVPFKFYRRYPVDAESAEEAKRIIDSQLCEFDFGSK